MTQEDYKREINTMIDNIQSEEMLNFFYTFIKEILKEEDGD